MKNKSKATPILKKRLGLLTLWRLNPDNFYQKNLRIFTLVNNWVSSLSEIPINYLIQQHFRLFWKRRKYSFYLKYLFLKKNIVNNNKKKYISFYLKRINPGFKINKRIKRFWRPKHVTATQLGSLSFRWFRTGLHINLPIFFLPSAYRISLKKVFKVKRTALRQKKNLPVFVKKSKIQTLKLFFMKLILERKLQKIFKFPIILNFRVLSSMSKKERRIQTTQKVVFEDFFFFKRDKLFLRSVHIFAFGLYFTDSKIISQHIAARLTRTRKHMRTLKQIHQTLNYLRLLLPETSGYQIDIYGKIGAKTRTKFFRMSSGQVPITQTLATRVQYTYSDCYSYTGVFGVHVWLCTAF
jgi:hypothetical protein